MVRKRKKKSGSFRRRALKSARTRQAKALRLKMRGMTASRVRLDRQGYDSRGRYFGTGAPLYQVLIEHDDVEGRIRPPAHGYVRAHSSKEAKQEALARPHHWGIRN